MQMQMLACWLVVVVVVGVVVVLMLLMLPMLPMLPGRGPWRFLLFVSALRCALTAVDQPIWVSVWRRTVSSSARHGCRGHRGRMPGGSRGGPAHSVHCMWGCLVRDRVV
jgi:hypothetical protein